MYMYYWLLGIYGNVNHVHHSIRSMHAISLLIVNVTRSKIICTGLQSYTVSMVS